MDHERGETAEPNGAVTHTPELIAAAPRLLEAAKMALEIIFQYGAEDYEVGGVHYKTWITEAIAEAEGRA